MQKKTIDRKDLIVVRDYCITDRNFIMATWLKGLYYGDSFYSQIPKNIFMENHHRIIEKNIDDPRTKIKVACLKDDADTILGYSVYRDLGPQGTPVLVLDWVFVKLSWRNIGVAKSLVPASTRAYTHITKSGASIIKEKLNHLIFNPYLFA